MFKGLLVAIVLIVCGSSVLHAQTAESLLQEAAKDYNAFNELLSGFKAETMTEEDMMLLEEREGEGEVQLREVIRMGSADEIRVARYFLANFKCQLAFGYARYNDLESLDAIFDEIEADIIGFTPDRFPLNYKYFGQNYTIQYENFGPTQANYLANYGERLLVRGKLEKSRSMLQKAAENSYTSAYQRYVCYDQLIESKIKVMAYDTELAKWCVEFMVSYDAMSQKEKDFCKEKNFHIYDDRAKTFNETLKVLGTFPTEGELCLRAARLISKYTDASVVTESDKRQTNADNGIIWYSLALTSGGQSLEVHKEAFDFCKKWERGNTNSVLILDLIAAMAVTCEDLQYVATNYEAVSSNQKAADYKKRADDCLEKRQEDYDRAQRQARVNARRNDRNFLIYAGVNIFPLLGKHKSPGGVLNIGIRNVIVEASYLKVNSKRENTFDLDMRNISSDVDRFWSGSFSHVAFKFPGKSGWDEPQARGYAGFLLAYNERTFQPFNSDVTNLATKTVTSELFQPKSTQYIMMFNYGAMLVKGMGLDAFIGIGAAYNTFDGGNATYYRNADFSIADAFVQNRPKNYWSYTMRIGLTMGFGWTRDK